MYVISEIGSNFRDQADCVTSIAAAKIAGADAVKFQLFSHRELYGYDGPAKDGQLPREWIPVLADKAKATGIDFLCTAFSVNGLKFIDPYVTRHKIASSDLTHLDLLRAAKATGKPVLLSTGASSEGDIRAALSVLNGADVTLLYCVSDYPARITDLRMIPLMRDKFRYPVGLSDHSTEIISVPVGALEKGAVVLEKHMTAFPELQSPDRPHSLTADEFLRMTKALEGLALSPAPEERAMFLQHNRRLVAMVDIPKGAHLQHEENFGAYRSKVEDGRGLIPFAYPDIHGKRATRDLKQGEGVGPGDFA